jgi:hypothetical protein
VVSNSKGLRWRSRRGGGESRRWSTLAIAGQSSYDGYWMVTTAHDDSINVLRCGAPKVDGEYVDRASSEAFFFNFCVTSYQSDYNKVVNICTGFNSIIGTLVIPSLDQAQSALKLIRAHCQPWFSLQTRLTVQLLVLLTPNFVQHQCLVT